FYGARESGSRLPVLRKQGAQFFALGWILIIQRNAVVIDFRACKMPRTMTSPRGISKTAAVEQFVDQVALVIQVGVVFVDGVNSRGLAGLGQRTNGAFMGCTVMGIQVQH